MESLITILAFGGLWFLIWIFSVISNIIDEKRARRRTQVADEVLKGIDTKRIILECEEKLKYIGHERGDIFSGYTHPQVQVESLNIKILGQCPTCENGYLQLRKGPYGKFLGCSSYPNCRHTEVDRTMEKYKQIVGEKFWNDIEKAYY